MQLLSLKSGPLSMLFDRESAFLRHIRFGEIEIVRGVYAAIRDRDWNTIPFALHDLSIDQRESDFHISFLAVCQMAGIHFEWRGDLSGSADGTIEYRFSGIAHSTFLKNRIGLCVLHPIAGFAGEPCRVDHTDGTVTSGTFPKWISPHQPFKNMAAISHQVTPEVAARVEFVGEAFEMEDQRNWTDASFKTYSTPLALPFPVEVPSGSVIDHCVKIQLIHSRSKDGEIPSRDMPSLGTPLSGARSTQVAGFEPEQPVQPRLIVAKFAETPRPSIGLSMSTLRQQPSEQVISRLRQLSPDHLRVDLWLISDRWKTCARNAIELAAAIDAQLEIAIFADDLDGARWQECLTLLKPYQDRIARWMFFHPVAKTTPADLIAAASDSQLKNHFSGRVVFGTNAYFAELNRQRPAVPENSAVCYSINPQVHAFDKLSIRETLAAQRSSVDSADQIFRSKVIVSPITLRPRLNPNSTSALSSDIDQTEPETDDRQSTGFTAAWSVGVLNALATHPSIESLTFFETFGPRGIIDEIGRPYPIFDVFASILKAVSIQSVTSSMPLDLAAVSMLNGDGHRFVIVANMSENDLTTDIEDSVGMQRTLSVPAESVKVIDWVLNGK